MFLYVELKLPRYCLQNYICQVVICKVGCLSRARAYVTLWILSVCHQDYSLQTYPIGLKFCTIVYWDKVGVKFEDEPKRSTN
jgi:hypothetical protein